MQDKLPWREEVKRKVFHIFWILLALWGWWGIPKYGLNVIMGSFIGILFLFLLFDFLRVEYRWSFLKDMIRAKECLMFCGATTGMLGVVLVFAMTDTKVAVLATVFMGIGDIVAGITRKKLGCCPFLKKTVEDFVIGLLANILVGLFLIPRLELVIPMALAAQLAENAVSVLDDNLMMVLSAGLIGQLILML